MAILKDPRWLVLLLAFAVGAWLLVPPVVLHVGPWLIAREDWVRVWPLCLAIPFIGRRLFQFSLLDLPMILFCLCPLVAGIANETPVLDAFNETKKEFLYWFFPYWFGRHAIESRASRHLFAWILIAGCGICVLPVVYEISHGPVIAGWFTGGESLAWRGADRGGSFRPSLFFPTGFVLTMFFAWSCILSFAFARSFLMRQSHPFSEVELQRSSQQYGIACVSTGALFFVLLVACRSLGSIVLGTLGAVSCVALPRKWRGIWLICLIAIPSIYIVSRITGIASAERIVAGAKQFTSETRADSLGYRLRAEEIVFDRMKDHWWLGFGTWGGWTLGKPAPIALDGFWLFCLTRTGMISVLCWWMMVALPCGWLTWCRTWHALTAVEFAFALIVCLSLVDGMFNYFSEAPLLMCIGLITTMAIQSKSNPGVVTKPT